MRIAVPVKDRTRACHVGSEHLGRTATRAAIMHARPCRHEGVVVDRARRAFGASVVGLLAGGAVAQDARDDPRVVLYTSTDPAALRPLINDFRLLYPQVLVEPQHLNSR
jgi:hypothetical protein